LTLIESVNEEYLKRDAFTCEQCHTVNVFSAKRLVRRKKRAHMVYSDDMTWFSLKAAAATVGMNMGAFLTLLLGLWQRERHNMSAIAEDIEGVNPRA
jgi:hypothetical protein